MLRAMKLLSASALALTVSLLATGDAAADTRSWTAVKKVVGKGDTAVVSIDIAQLRSSASFKAGLDLITSEEAEFRTIMDAVKSDCGFDVITSLSDITVVFQKDGDDPLIAFGLDGVDEPRVVSCLGKIAGKMTNNPAVTLKGKKVGKVTEYSVDGEAKKLYAAWLAKDVLAFTDDANDKKRLEKRLTGKGISPDLKKMLAKTSAAAPFWFAVAMKEKERGRTILGGYGKFELAAGIFKGAGAMVMSKPAEATDMAAEGTEALKQAKAEIIENKLIELGKVMDTVTIGATGAELTITASVPDKDVPTILKQFDKVF